MSYTIFMTGRLFEGIEAVMYNFADKCITQRHDYAYKKKTSNKVYR